MRTLVSFIVLFLAAAAFGQTTRPSDGRPEASSDPNKMLEQLLTPARNEPLLPQPDAPRENSASRGVAPNAPLLNLIREGTWIHDQVGRVQRTADGQPEFVFESDGRSMTKPPMLILPNLQLMQMEHALKNASRDVKFSITGMVTEYNARNFILVERVLSATSTPLPRAPTVKEQRQEDKTNVVRP